jgi:nucleotide-binding universal stress UspA family protein
VSPAPRPIIVAYDGSDEARGAVLWALREAAPDQALMVVAVLGHEPSPLPVLSHIAGPPDEAERVTKHIVSQWDEDVLALDHLLDLQFYRGHPAQTLAEIAERENAEMIVVGHRRERAFSALRGSVARDLMRMAACPVVVVP